MRKKSVITYMVIIIIIAVIAFMVLWMVKLWMPIDRPDDLISEAETPWYLSSYTSPVVEEAWMIDPTIPANYVPVPGETEMYMIVDTKGVVTGYKQRHQDENGKWIWEDVNPDIPNNYELVKGSENLYKVTDKDGNVSYFLYIRNEDDTYAFVPADEYGNPYYDGTDAEVITNNFKNLDGNIYTVYNNDGVKEGYAERTKDEKGGGYVWKSVKDPKPRHTAKQEKVTTEKATEDTHIDVPTIPKQEQLEDGLVVKTNRTTSTKTENGYVITYETIVKNTYDKQGNLLYTEKEGPTEIKRVKASESQTPDPSQIKDTLDGEYKRVKKLVTYNTDLANEVLATLNAERASAGLSQLKMSKDSEAYKLACIRAADMSLYKYSSAQSPMYGTLDDMVKKWGCTTANASENVWSTGNRSAEDIHSRLQANEGSRLVRMSDYYTEVGIAIVSVDDQLYIAEIYLK